MRNMLSYHVIVRASWYLALVFKMHKLRKCVVKLALLSPPQNGGSTPLTLAVEGGHSDCVDVLIEEGANVDLPKQVTSFKP